jgi:anti-sigma B factor antagonist
VSELELHCSPDTDGFSVVVTGEIDMATAPQLRELLDGLVDDGATRILLECRELGFLDSSGIGVLVAARKRLGEAGELIVASPPPHVRKVLEITGVAAHLTLR